MKSKMGIIVKRVVRPERFERPTAGTANQCSIQLSYLGIFFKPFKYRIYYVR